MGTEDADTRAKYERVCRELNLDQLTMDSAWKDYKSISEDYVLEGSCIEWLGCALYVAGQSTFQETVEGGHSSGNKVSLTQILRATKLSLIEFFRKIKKWSEMAKLSSGFTEKVETLERKFEVASIIFDKYKKEFCDIFQCPEDKQTPGGVRQCGRKSSKLRPYSTLDLFKYGWVLYVHIKSQFPLISDDLVNSHHLLLCCIDMLFGASLVRRRKDLLNPSSFLVPEGFDFDSTEGIQQDEIPCVLSELCNKYRGIEKDCRVIRDYHWRPAIKKLFEHSVLVPWNQTLDESITAMLSAASFYANDKSVNGKYELKMLTEGEFDERIFLLQNASEEIGTPPRPPLGVNGARLIMGASYQGSPQVQFGTPLMNREYLPGKEPKLTPISDAAHTVDQLCTLLEGCPPEPSDHLVKAFSSCATNPYPVIAQRMVTMSEQFLEEFKYENQASQETFAQVRLRLSQSLYYKLLEGIVSDEEKKKTTDTRGTSTLQAMLEYEVFHKSLFALCVEVVLYSYNCQSRAFPWVLELYGISPYHFYRVIEVVIRAEYETSSEGFPRGIVKHLNRVEEMVLSHLAWKSDSPFFAAVDAAGSVPSYEEVAPSSPSSMRTLSSPFPLPPMRTPGKGGFDSPLSTGPSDHILSPGSGARRQLFSPNSMPSGKKMTAPSKMAPRTIAPKPTSSIQIGGVMATPLGKVTSTLPLQMVPPSTSTTVIATSHHQDVVQMSTVSNSAGTQTSPLQRHSSATAGKPRASEETEGGPGDHHTGVDLEEALASLPPTSPPRGHAIQKMSPLVKFAVSAQSSLTGPQADPGLHHRLVQATPLTSPPKPKRSGSLALFYRKVYQLAFVRIKDLCERLNLPCETQQKIWTCFEHVMKLTPDLMRDRHMDQLIMCSVYVLSKASPRALVCRRVIRAHLTFSGSGYWVCTTKNIHLPSLECTWVYTRF
ncbi:hypothetical protein EMCRGX_G031191 [Ephydatia muelleri]